MKFSEKWLREWIDPDADLAAIVEQLTLLGLEVDEFGSAQPGFRDVVVARIESVKPHPDADRLRVCAVNDGSGDNVQVVCGAPNAREGLVSVLARVGGQMPDGMQLRKAKLRGVQSFGMLCSAAELDLAEDKGGIMELPADAVPGTPLEDYLQLDDAVIDIDLTPDRGDCLSIRGIARDLSAKYDLPVKSAAIDPVAVENDATCGVHIEVDNSCVRYTGRAIVGVDLSGTAPLWMSERLRRSGIRAINPAVDITNYVMLELGQPMHAFDLDKIQGSLHVRLARPQEKMVLLDGRDIAIDDDTTVIADDHGAVALAGIMGGERTAVDENTQRLFFESALFLPEQTIGKPRRYNALSESAHRYERGVDPAGQIAALEYASRLLIDVAGGSAGPVVDEQHAERLPIGQPVSLRRSRLARVLGVEPPAKDVTRILSRLGVTVEDSADGWRVTPPTYRYDLRIEEDFIAEVGRVQGFEALPRTNPAHSPEFQPAPETAVSMDEVKLRLVDRGYQEIVSYSFVDEKRVTALRPDLAVLPLANPLSSELGVMRTTLLCGLLDAMQHNLSRQQSTLRLFETGLRFLPVVDTDAPSVDSFIASNHGNDLQLDDSLVQQQMVAGLCVGEVVPEGWNQTPRDIDFFDVKGDLERLFARANGAAVHFVACQMPMLHPGQAATIMRDGKSIGYVGTINPQLQRTLDLSRCPVVFELSAAALLEARVPEATAASKYPQVRRDMALLINRDITHEQLLTIVKAHAPEWMQDTVTFDVYDGDKIGSDKKSVALGLIMQSFSRTLSDTEVDKAVADIVAAANAELGAVLRV